MKIIVPMAGMGKRMRPHTHTTAKPLLPIAGKPIVQRLVEDLAAVAGEAVEEVAFIVHPSFGKKVEESSLVSHRPSAAKAPSTTRQRPWAPPTPSSAPKAH